MKPHIHRPEKDAVMGPADGVIIPFEGNVIAPSAPPPVPPEPTVNVPLLLAIAKDETEVYRRHLAGLVELWDSLGVMGFVCARQDRVADFLAKLHEVKSILKG